MGKCINHRKLANNGDNHDKRGIPVSIGHKSAQDKQWMRQQEFFIARPDAKSIFQERTERHFERAYTALITGTA
ncbi:hypothetical protein D3C85_1711360 [compost metagenome]